MVKKFKSINITREEKKELMGTRYAEISKEEIQANLAKEPMRVKHSSLTRSGDSQWQSNCPICSIGILLVYRDMATYIIKERDNCIHCGRLFIYEDIEDMRSKDWAGK